ncbi:MAG: sulfite exporter TauE/SafE family protein [Nocardioidaceae bacterium]
MGLGLDLWVVVALAAAVVLGAAVQGLVGLGVGLVAAPVTSLLAPDLMPGLLLWLAASMPVVTLLREHDAIDWRGIAWSMPARLPGTVLGVVLVAAFAERQLGLFVAVMVLVAVALTVRTISVPVTRTALMTAGFVSGVTGTATSIGGPPMALLYQHRDPRQVRCTLAVYFLLGAAMSLVGLAIEGELDVGELVLAVILLPGLVLGFVVSRVLHRRVDPSHLRPGILFVCSIGAVVLLVRSLF